MSIPTRFAQERWTTVNQNDFLQLVDENHGGAILAWINYLGELEGAFAFGGDLPDLNGILFVDGNKYKTVQAAINAAVAAGPGGMVVCPPNYTETITSTLLVGTATNRVILYLCMGTKLTINVTDGSDGVIVQKGSGIVGEMHGGAINSTNAGSVIQLATTAVVQSIISTPGSTDNNFFCRLQNLRVDGAQTASISRAGVFLLDMLNLSVVRDVYVSNCLGVPGIICTADNFTSGPLALDNCWVECNNLAGSTGLLITGGFNSGTHGQDNIQVRGGAYNNPGTGLASIKVDGLGSTGHFLNSITFMGVYTETGTNTGCFGYDLVDCTNINLLGCEASNFSTGGTGVRIRETVAHLTVGIQITGFRIVGAALTGISNTISGESVGTSSAVIQSYYFGEEGSGGTQRSLGPIYSFPQTAQFGVYNHLANGFADVVCIPSVPGTKNPLNIMNFADHTMFVDLANGITTPQELGFRFCDYSTGSLIAQWRLRKSATNDFLLQDELGNAGSGLNRFIVIRDGATNLSAGAGANGVAINQTTGTGTTGLAVYSGGATPLIQGSLNSNGLIVKNAAGTQNVGQISQNGNTTFRNFADSSLLLTLDGGNSAAQDTYLAWSDRGTVAWRLRKDATGQSVLSDVINGVNRWTIPPVAAISTLGVFNFANTEFLAWRNAANSADLSVRYDSSNVFVISGNAKAPIFNGTSGFQHNGVATSGFVLRGNGTNFVNSALAAADLSNGVTGSGAVMLAASPSTTGTLTAAAISASGIVTGATLIESTTHTPSTAGDTGTTGQIAWDASFIYIATNTNTWKRIGISSW